MPVERALDAGEVCRAGCVDSVSGALLPANPPAATGLLSAFAGVSITAHLSRQACPRSRDGHGKKGPAGRSRVETVAVDTGGAIRR